MDHLSIAVLPFTQGFHHQLLQVTAEHLQPVPVGKDNHVALPPAIPCHEPSRSHQCRWVAPQVLNPGGLIHLGRPRKKIADVASDQGAG